MRNDVSFFFCFNKRISDYLKSKGIDLVTVAKDLKQNKIFSLYVRTPELDAALTEYQTLKNDK